VHSILRIVPPALLVVFAVFDRLPSSDTPTLTCYCACDDADGDGYARTGATGTVFERPEDQKLTCPSGYVPAADDCDDNDPTIHPRREEKGPNGKDDDCDGLTDEPQLLYPADAAGCTTSGFPIELKINNQEVINARDRLWADAEYARLSDSADTLRTLKTRVNLTTSDNRYYAVFTLTNLQETTVYRCRITFYQMPRTVSRSKSRPGTTKRQPVTYTELGETSNWYYATTTGTEDKSVVRTNIVMKALRQYFDSSIGKIGRLGYINPNGTRFGADLNEYWCSEFYSWCAENWLTGISGLDCVSELQDYFAGYGGYYTESDIDDGDRGDYLACGTSHSGMFLALDKKGSTDPQDWELWTIEGNVSNQVLVMRRTMADYDFGLGHIMHAQLK
jgi:hypothetical protein